MKEKMGPIATGVVIGLAALLLVGLGNPANMGFCIACFLRDIAGALGLHRAEAVQYVRPEIFGIVLGAGAMALFKKEWHARGGSSPVTRFVLGFFVMVGALMFLGCPLRMLLRIGGGDFSALIGLLGFAAGIFAGTRFLNKGFSLKRAYPQPAPEGAILPFVSILALALLLIVPGVFRFSESGPGAMRAPFWIALASGLIVGGLSQRSRFCMAGGLRDAMLFKDFHLLMGSGALVLTVLIGNIALGRFNPGFSGQPIASADALWNFLGMALVGWGSVLLGGCPLRQLVLSGEGNSDSALAVLGMLTGAAFCHNFGWASSAAGPTLNGQIAVGAGLLLMLLISFANIPKEGK